MGRRTIFVGLPKGGNFFSTHVSFLKMLRSLWIIQIWGKNTKENFDPLTRPPSRPLGGTAGVAMPYTASLPCLVSFVQLGWGPAHHAQKIECSGLPLWAPFTCRCAAHGLSMCLWHDFVCCIYNHRHGENSPFNFADLWLEYIHESTNSSTLQLSSSTKQRSVERLVV